MFDHQLVDFRVGGPDVLEEHFLLGEHFSADIAFDGI
jgi:hypothetical protein